jgi:hypothetical protein
MGPAGQRPASNPAGAAPPAAHHALQSIRTHGFRIFVLVPVVLVHRRTLYSPCSQINSLLVLAEIAQLQK